jgi:DNA (cytosine-5)-methyltransferase 1
MKSNKKPKVLDLFSGCGGMSLGFEQAGFDIKLGIDNWSDALSTFKKNHENSKIHKADLSMVNPSDFDIGNIDVVIGGPPCQGFSIAGKRIIEDERNDLYKSFVKFVNFFQPKVFVMENVPNILSMGNGSVKNKIIKDFSNLGYNVECTVLLASDFGVPQNRKRAFFVGVKGKGRFDFSNIIKKQKINSKDAISDLPDASIVDNSNYPLSCKSSYQKQMRQDSNRLFNHQLTNHKEKTIEIISLVPDGGNYKNLPEHLKDTRKVNIAWTRLNSQKPSFTIDTGHRHHFHYKFNRVPTVRESARIQSFPDSFIFLGSKTSQYKQVGNAVPPLLAKQLANSLMKYLNV